MTPDDGDAVQDDDRKECGGVDADLAVAQVDHLVVIVGPVANLDPQAPHELDGEAGVGDLNLP